MSVLKTAVLVLALSMSLAAQRDTAQYIGEKAIEAKWNSRILNESFPTKGGSSYAIVIVIAVIAGLLLFSKRSHRA